MDEDKHTESRFRVRVWGNKHTTSIEAHIPTFWIWVVIALALATRFPDLWEVLKEILQNWTVAPS